MNAKSSFLIVSEPFEKIHGGIERHALILGQFLSKKGHTVEFVTPKRILKKNMDQDFIIFEGINRKTLLNFYLFRRKILNKKIIFTHGSFYDLIHRKELRKIGYKYGPKAYFKLIFDRILMHKILDHFDFIFTISTVESRDLCQTYARLNKNIIDLQVFYKNYSPISSPVNSTYKKYRPYVASVARLHFRKNHIALLKAVESLKVNFLLAGDDQGELEKLRKYANLNHIKNFFYLGRLEEQKLNELLNGASCIILPSFLEGTPLLVYEALQLGRPVILTKHNYLGNLDGVIECGIEPDELNKCIKEVLSRKVVIPQFNVLSNEEVINTFLNKIETN